MFPIEVFGARRAQPILTNKIELICYIHLIFMSTAIAVFYACNSAYTVEVYMRMRGLGTLDHALRSRAAKPNK
jgi:hypothetical protein